MKNVNKIIIAAIATVWMGSAMAQTIPLDPAVRTGKLANGLTYYIRNNNEPQKRVQLYLVNKVGSVLEDEDQRGLAHFMEHMNFNGTKNFPKNELIDYLQKAGVSFGADLNAYTSFNETVYELPIPTDDPSMLGNGLKILRDWARDATLDSIEIEKERGVVLEEERLGKGANERLSRHYYPVMLNHSRYAERIPIGLDQVLINFKPAVIRRFHSDWYRPDLQAVIIVGDIDVDKTEKIIQTDFADLKNPVNERPRTQFTVPLTGQNQFLAVTDKEQPAINLEILIKHKATAIKTNADYEVQIKKTLFNQLFAARKYAVVNQEKDPAYIGINANIQDLLGGLNMFAFDVTPKQGQLEHAFTQAWSMVENVKRYGFTQTELDRAKRNYIRSLESAVKELSKTSSAYFVDEYKHLFLQDEASPGIVWEYEFTKNHISNITLADINLITKEYLKDVNRDIVVLAPEKDKTSLPDSATVIKWVNEVSNSNMATFKDNAGNGNLLSTKPKAGTVISKTQISELNTTILKFSNGVRVVLKPTDFKNDEILFTAFSPGGLSLYNEQGYQNALNAAPMVSRFGLGNLNPVQLSAALNGKAVQSSANISNRSEVINGSASPIDLETALQLVYLQFTHPRLDTGIFKKVISNAKESVANRYADPGNVFSDTISYVLGSYNFRSAPPSVKKIDEINLQKAFAIYKDRFADASGFTFVFVGNFEVGEITPLLEEYLGSLPSLHRNEKARSLGIHIPSGRIVKKVYKGSENKALVRLVVSGGYCFSPDNNLQLKALGDILQIKILQHLREDESEVYSPSVQVSYNKFPKNRYAIIISFGCAPKNTDHLIAMVEKETDKLREEGPDADDVQKFKAAYVKNVELALKDNSFWLSYLSSQYENDENILDVLSTNKFLESVTPASLKTAASIFISGQNMISFELLPEETANK